MPIFLLEILSFFHSHTLFLVLLVLEKLYGVPLHASVVFPAPPQKLFLQMQGKNSALSLLLL